MKAAQDAARRDEAERKRLWDAERALQSSVAARVQGKKVERDQMIVKAVNAGVKSVLKRTGYMGPTFSGPGGTARR